MIFMWHLTNPKAKETIEEAVVFEEEILSEYLRDGWRLEGKFQVVLLEGTNLLPNCIEKS